MKNDEKRRLGAMWIGRGVLLSTLALALAAGCGSSGGSSHDGGSGADAGSHAICMMDYPDSCFAPSVTVRDLCEAEFLAGGARCQSEVVAWLTCNLPGPPDGGACADCTDVINAYNGCITGR
ncbi:MAG: hypothetical protein GW913_11910 [Myxococcales bacterium]|nr:hypothetical protein [Myxococcales bacterium]